MTSLDASLRRLGIEGSGEVPWGTHFCLFYTTDEDLLDLLVQYFKTGLECNTSYLLRHFVVITKLRTGGWCIVFSDRDSIQVWGSILVKKQK